MDFLVLPKGAQQVDIELQRRVLLTDGLAQGNKNRVQRLLAVAPAVPQVFFPRAEKLERTRGILDFVADVVRPAAVGVDIVKMLMQAAREEPGNDAKIFVVMCGEPARVALGFGDAATQRRQAAGNFEFGRRQHIRSLGRLENPPPFCFNELHDF